MPLLALAALLLAMAALLIGFAAAGPKRRAQLLKHLEPAMARLRAVAKPRPPTAHQG